MNRSDCEREKLSSRTIGLMILPLAPGTPNLQRKGLKGRADC